MAGVLVVPGVLSRLSPGACGAGVAEKFATRAVGPDEGKFDGNLGSIGGIAGAGVWQSAVEIRRAVARADSVHLDPGGAQILRIEHGQCIQGCLGGLVGGVVEIGERERRIRDDGQRAQTAGDVHDSRRRDLRSNGSSALVTATTPKTLVS